MNKISIQKIKDKDEKYFEQIYNEYYPLVKYVVFDIIKNMEDTKDICQDVFCTLYEKIDQFSGQKSFKYWLLQIAKNKALNHLKKIDVENRYLSYESFKLNLETDQEQANSYLWKLLEEELSEEERKIVILKSVFDYSFGEIAEELNLNKTYCFRKYKLCIKKLNKIMRGVQ